MAARMLIGVSLAVLCTLRVAALPDRDLEAEVARFERQFPVVTEKTFEEFVQAIETTSYYRFARDLEVAQMSDRIAAWREELGAEIEVTSVSFFGWLAESDWGEHGVTVGFRRFQVMREQLECGRGAIRFLTLRIEEESGKARYLRIPHTLLKTADFRFVQSAQVLYPLFKIVPEFEANDETLGAVLKRLAEIADVDFVGSQDLESVRVGVRLRGKSVYECLVDCAAAARYAVWRREGGGGRWSQRVRAHKVLSFDQAITLYSNRRRIELLGVGEPPETAAPAFETPQETLEYLVERAAAELRNRTVVTMRPAGEKI